MDQGASELKVRDKQFTQCEYRTAANKKVAISWQTFVMQANTRPESLPLLSQCATTTPF